jgi:hypothetical protein
LFSFRKLKYCEIGSLLCLCISYIYYVVLVWSFMFYWSSVWTAYTHLDKISISLKHNYKIHFLVSLWHAYFDINYISAMLTVSVWHSIYLLLATVNGKRIIEQKYALEHWAYWLPFKHSFALTLLCHKSTEWKVYCFQFCCEFALMFSIQLHTH